MSDLTYDAIIRLAADWRRWRASRACSANTGNDFCIESTRTVPGRAGHAGEGGRGGGPGLAWG